MPALGERFRAAREARGLTLSDVAEHIRIRSVYLAAIEDENWPAIGAPVYTRGFLRTYARFLGLDPEQAVAEFNGQSNTVIEPPAPVAPGAPPKTTYLADEAPSQRTLSPLIWVASLVAVVLIAFIVYNEAVLRARQTANALPSNSPVALATQTPAADASAESSENPSPQASDLSDASPGASLSPGASASPLAAADGPTLEVRVSAPSWLRVQVDGNVSMEGTFPAGTVRQFHGKIATLRIGNAGGVEIIVDGKSLGKLGQNGDVVERSFTL
jgi:cytoskeletal protein RodZ